ncbi:unnamed protein product [Dibothriocephalus latus]|uniref:Uncharacterized protein n=1 Tax=Dibothriocephalus latus TaxID=60516 RepID=A0A3P7P1T9_DIBLA|nr:unnamed protein product [Dibothriocephalus latus]
MSFWRTTSPRCYPLPSLSPPCTPQLCNGLL